METPAYEGTKFFISVIREGASYRGQYSCALCKSPVSGERLFKDEPSALVDARLAAQAHAKTHINK